MQPKDGVHRRCLFFLREFIVVFMAKNQRGKEEERENRCHAASSHAGSEKPSILAAVLRRSSGAGSWLG